MGLHNDFHVRVVSTRHCLNGLRSGQQLTDMVLQSTSDLICVSYIWRENEKLLSANKITMLSRDSSCFPSMFRHDTRFMDLVHHVLKYSMTFELSYDV